MNYSTPRLAERVAHYTQEIILPNILNWEKNRTADRSFLTAAADFGLLGLETPLDKGGLGGSFLDKVAMAREMSQASMAVTFALINSQNIAARLSGSPVSRHAEEIAPLLRSGKLVGCTALTEPSAGSDFAAIQTSATKTAGGWILNGEKAWITNAAHADIIMLYAQTDPEKGWRGIASFLIDARNPGFKRGDCHDILGGHSIGAGGFSLTDYFAPDEDRLAAPGDAFKYAMTSINGARTYVAAMCAGMLRNALDQAITYGKERTSFGQPLLQHQGLKWTLADLATERECLDLLTAKAAHHIHTGADAVLSAAYAKKYAGEITVPGVTACIQAMGANGLKADTLLGHHLACAKIAAYTDGSTEMMKERIAAFF
ncbi:acyl-CoA dehydrogenase family protein [Sneathiella aquimaris]|uniref:acyl-CoA dehydrogenase family protein n=1 Tax=Sneathiella aquimaris TaxID=2599305 RepID=UPI00146E31BD|nr:acyl-CoA dehydrogenase family protein [Sneathiella aquimaris]